MDQIGAYDLVRVAKFYDSLTRLQQHGCNKIQDQVKTNLTRQSITKKDYSRAFYWIEKAADMNNPESMIQLGFMYCRGHGVEKNIEQGEILLDKVISRNLDFTAEIVSLFHASGDMQNCTLAYKWYKRLEILIDEKTMFSLMNPFN
jgi:lipopolysaccharide biosynthesis regulator YciM